MEKRINSETNILFPCDFYNIHKFTIEDSLAAATATANAMDSGERKLVGSEAT